MRETYVLGDLMQTLIRLEEKGNLLYLALAEKQTTLEARKLFVMLAEQEEKHKRLYKELLNELEEDVEHDPEYMEYIDVLLNGTVEFMTESVDAVDMKSAYTIAVRLEKDTLLFLGEVKQVVPTSAHHLIEKVQVEERKHLKLLAEYWKNLNL